MQFKHLIGYQAYLWGEIACSVYTRFLLEENSERIQALDLAELNTYCMTTGDQCVCLCNV